MSTRTDQHDTELGDSAPLVSVLIKTLNEESKIEACLRSVLLALTRLGCSSEVIVADSVSSDQTVQIAQRFPVTLVQFSNIEDRGCGAGVELGFQHSSGTYVLLLDGDMVLEPDFLPAALAGFERDAGLAGIAGLMREAAIRNAFDANRVEKGAASIAGSERWLNGGGLYRRQAILQAGGYAAHQGLKGWEEAELGMRLRAAGWRLSRIDTFAVTHCGHSMDTLPLLRSLWRSGRAFASGVLLRQSVGHPWFWETAGLLLHPLAVCLWWLILALALTVNLLTNAAAPLWIWGAVGALAFLALCQHKRSFHRAMRSVLLWHYHALGLLGGLFLRVPEPLRKIPSHVLQRH